MIEMMVYTVVGIILYFLSDWILVKVENVAGRKFDNRNLAFFAIIMTLALGSFAVIRLLLPQL